MNAEHRVPEWTKPENLRWAAWGWDHLTYYRRLGAGGVPFWGDTRWLDKWWKRLNDEKTLDQIADLGVNALVCYFFKGMGMKAEKTMLDDLRRLVERCRPRGIRLIGYTFGTIFTESFVQEVPEAADWIARKRDGSPEYWSYYRCMPCYNSGYYDYLLKLLDFGAKDIGLNGFHFDNFYSMGCYCERCAAKFRVYLEKQFPCPEQLGLRDFSHVTPTPINLWRRDPFAQAWTRFRGLELAEKMAGIRAHVKAIDQDLAILSNPAFPRRANWANERGVNPVLFGRQHDLLFAENANFPSTFNGETVSQANAYAYGDSIGYGVVVTCWPRSPETGAATLPDRESQAIISTLEPALFGHPAGTTWASRSVKGDRVAMDNPALAKGARKTLDFLRKRRDLFAGARTDAAVALLHSFDSFAFANDQTAPAYDGFERFLSREGVPYRIAFTEEPERFADYRHVIVSNQVCLSDATIQALSDFVAKGGRLIVTGVSGERDENWSPREDNPFAALSASRDVLLLPDAPETMTIERDSSGKWMERYTWEAPPRRTELRSAIVKAFGESFFPFRLDAPSTVLPILRTLPDGRRVIHLLNYDDTAPATRVTLTLGSRFDGQTRCRVHRLEGGPVETPICPQRTIVIDDLELYAGVEL